MEIKTARISRREGLKYATLASLGLVAAACGASSSAGSSEKLTIRIFRGEEGIKGPDGKGHDAFVPSSFVLQAGVTTPISVVNYDEGPHTITAPAINLNQTIAGGKQKPNDEVEPVTTNFNLTVNNKGVYRWYCALDCDAGGGHWAMSDGVGGPGKEGFMAGNIVVI